MEYFQSPQWHKKRKERLKIDNYECRLCGNDGSDYHLEVHHKPSSYTKIPNESVNNDLTTVCVNCHREIVTNLIRRNRYKDHKINISYMPKLAERALQDVKDSEVQTQFSMSVDHAQWRSSESDSRNCNTDEKINIQERQDNRRP